MLWAAILKLNEEQPVDVVLSGKQAIDGDTGQVPPGVATRLGWPQLTYVRKIREIDFAAKRDDKRATQALEKLLKSYPDSRFVGRARIVLGELKDRQ